jgi:fructose-1,6-bisphosphatase II / sedoheptulose-1,7-bisphosphatase
MSSKTLDRSLVLDAVRVTEAAAIASWTMVGRGDEKAADQAAVDAMRNGAERPGDRRRDRHRRGRARRGAHALYRREGRHGQRPAIDIALDPLEGTTLTAKAMPNALAVMAWAPKGTLLNAPDTYMDKIACGPGLPPGVIDLDKSPAENVKAAGLGQGRRAVATSPSACWTVRATPRSSPVRVGRAPRSI